MAFNDSMDQFANEKREYVMGETSEDIDPTDWKESEVVKWLRSLGLGNYGDNFVKHCITGELLHMLTEEHFKELGVGPIGHRVRLARECLMLHKGAENRQRFKIHWEADQVIYSKGCCDWCLKQLCCVPCCEDPDHYKLTGATLYLSSEDRSKGKSSLCQTSRATRAVDLSTVAGVSDYHVNSMCDCGCAADVVMVELNAELGLDPVRPIMVKKGQGYKVSAMITRAVEETQARAPAAGRMSR